MTTTIGALFHSSHEAENAVHALRDAGLPKSSLQVYEEPGALDRCHDGKRGGAINWKIIILAAVMGAVVFGLGGTMAAWDNYSFGITELAQSLTLVVVFVLIGAAVGAFLGLFIGYNDCDCDAHLYREGLRRGGVVVLVEARGGQGVTALSVLEDAHAIGAKMCGQGGGH